MADDSAMEMSQEHQHDDDASQWPFFESFLFLRRLAGEKEEVIDYSVLSVAVLTLGLLMVVEFLRHKLDNAAAGRPFFKTVLEGMYRELATLGMVEFGVYLLQKYSTGYNKSMKAVFADVHFMLFFAALFNAVESVLLAICTSRVSHRMWVQTEQLDVDNYLELREEFERVDKELSRSSSSSGGGGRYPRQDYEAEAAWEWNYKGLRRLRDGIREGLRNPSLKRKHHKLLVQVRFHELRVHFLKANDLPLKLKVSDYLKRSELHVLQKMVHISPFAWLLLTGGLNLLYFLLGMVAYATSDLNIVGTCMYAIFVGALAAFVLISLATFNKMKSIYRNIMHNRLIDAKPSDHNNNESAGGGNGEEDNDEKSIRAQEQRHLFWGGQPKYIIGISQLSQIGFAVALAILLVFPDEFDGSLSGWQLFIAVAVGYGIFLYIMARVIPRYTLCTSLGALVDRSRLQETLAAYHLEETRRKQQIRLEVQEAEKVYQLKQALKKANQCSTGSVKSGSHEPDKEKDSAQGSKSQPSTTSSAEQSIASALDLALGMGKTWQGGAAAQERRGSESSGSDRVLLAELVDTKTEDLRSVIPQERLGKTRTREERMKARRQARKKAVSDGVMSMRLMRPNKMSDAALTTLESVDETEVKKPSTAPPQFGSVKSGSHSKPRKRDNRRMRKSLSANAAVELMRHLEDDDVLAPAKPSDAAAGENPAPLHPLMEDIPIRAVPATEISIPVGRQSFNNGDMRRSAEHQEAAKPTVKRSSSSSTSGDSKGTVRFRDSHGEDILVEIASRSEPSSKGDSDAINNDGEMGTVGSSSRSEGGHSDCDDIPAVPPSLLITVEDKEPVRPLGDRLRKYFAGRMYKHVSAVFGTMICFFLVGMRVETLLHAHDDIPNTNNTWELTPGAAFWMETAWLCMFIIISSVMAYLFRPGCVHPKRLRCFLSGIMDVCLSALCLALLMISESQRSCNETEKRLLAEETYADSSIQCTQTFGNRVGDGVGNIEPFTSLIALRIFRFMVARRIVRFRRRKLGLITHAETFHLGLYDVTVRHDLHDAKETRKKGARQMENETGTPVELWNYAIGLFPDVVAKYGEFSAELLQAMLGIEIIDDQPINAPSAADLTLLPSPPPTTSENGEANTREPIQPLANSVRSVSDASSDEGFSTGSPRKDLSRKSSTNALNLMTENQFRAPVAPLEFEAADKNGTEMPPNTDTASSNLASPFIAPNARLIRSMRRCDRKLLPLLDVWTPVDVVMTMYELVYFEAPSVYEQAEMSASEQGQVNEQGRSIHQAVVATHGGKGLRLGDVAEGRKLVGRLDLSSIDSVHVERTLPRRAEFHHDTDPPPNTECIADEFWKPLNPDESIRGLPPREVRWEKVVHDDLMIESIHGMLYLRYYSDLFDTEISLDRPLNVQEDGDIYKNNALQWCQTIVRICGTQQLRHQHLPHFGDDNNDELRDYIALVDPNIVEGNRMTKIAKMKRNKSSVSLAGVERRSILSRGSSLGTHDQSPSPTKPKGHRRFKSLGTDAINKVRDNFSDVV